MKQLRVLHNLVVAALLAMTPAAAPAQETRPDVDTLLAELARPDQGRWMRLERQILREWARSGSATVDFLFQRGQLALREGRPDEAVAHFSAAIDHAPDFAEAWNARATAHFMANRLGPSLADIRETLARNPVHFGALSGLGAILERLQMRDQARAAYAEAARIHPHRPAIREALARLDLATAGRAL